MIDSEEGDDGRSVALDLHEPSSGKVAVARVQVSVQGERRVVALTAGSHAFRATSTVDFEEALTALRVQLDACGLLLLCNRFRRDAFVSSMARQMGDGLLCYLVQPGRPVGPERIVDALGPAPHDLVVGAAEAAAAVQQWIDGCAAGYGEG